MNGVIKKISGPLVIAQGLQKVKMYEVVKVGNLKLIGEVVELKGDFASVQVYEDTTGLMPGEEVVPTGDLLSVDLAPGLITSIYDGIQRPLELLYKSKGSFIPRGVDIASIDREKLWEFKPLVKVGDEICEGDIIGEVQETDLIVHKIMLPINKQGIVKEIKTGKFNIEQTILVLDDGSEICMLQKWPVRSPRKYLKKLPPHDLFTTGQRVIDSFFPLAKGGTACIPGPFGSGKTVVQHQLAKWAEVDIVVYIGCGERGNEMTDVLNEFPHLKDPKSGQPLIKRTVLIANTSNMPVSAREASVYTGITIAEYFRDMGYNVALMADSTSRWAEALREMSGRLEEMPGEEGYPAYLGTRIAEFYERAGRVLSLATQGKERDGSLTVIGAVSPPGGDLAEPVVQATLRVVKVFWSLEAKLAFRRHFPAINWLRSYSLYLDNVRDYFVKVGMNDFIDNRKKAMHILQEEASLEEIVRLVGFEALSVKDRITLETARAIREDFLHQNAFEDDDTYTDLEKQYVILKTILKLHEKFIVFAEKGMDFEKISALNFYEKFAKVTYKNIDATKDIMKEIDGLEG